MEDCFGIHSKDFVSWAPVCFEVYCLHLGLAVHEITLDEAKIITIMRYPTVKKLV